MSIVAFLRVFSAVCLCLVLAECVAALAQLTAPPQ